MKNKNMKNMALVLIVSSILLVLAINIASAEFWGCFSRGDKINYCNPNIPDRTASSDNYRLCMDSFNSTGSCYSPGNWNACNHLASNCPTNGGGGGGVDGEPPVLTLTSPTNNSVYTSRSVPFSFSLNEKSDVYYLDMINGRGKWTRVCSNCNSYSKSRSLKEGLNYLRFRAVDSSGNEAYKEIMFFVDSKDPKIKTTNPRKGFANGEFNVQFTEDNPTKVVLHYGNSENGMNKKNLSINNNCHLEKTKYICDTNVSLLLYNEQQIQYWFTVMDIAGNTDTSKAINLNVDTSPPIINNINYTISKKTATFTFNVTEPNFDSIAYYDNSESRPRWRTMCTRLKDNICVKKLTLKSGTHPLDIKVLDEAGNERATDLVVEIP